MQHSASVRYFALVILGVTLVAIITYLKRLTPGTAEARIQSPAAAGSTQLPTAVPDVAVSPRKTVVHTAPAGTRTRAEALHLVPTSEEQWQAEPVDPDFVQRYETLIWNRIAGLTNVVPTDIQCRYRTCKVEVEFHSGTTLAKLGADLNGFAPYRRTPNGWVLFFNPDFVEDPVD